MLKVLVIAYYYPPMGLSGVQRTLKFTKFMLRHNLQPTVITSDAVGYFAHDNSLLKEAQDAGIRILRVAGREPNALLKRLGTVRLPKEWIRKFMHKLSQTFFIPDNKISWSRHAFKKASEILSTEKFDLIFVTIPPFSSFSMAAKLKQKFDIPLFVDYRDIWYDSYLAFYPTPLHKYLNKKMEYNALKAADKISVTNRRVKERMLNLYKFLTFDDIILLPHGFDHEDFESTPAEPKPNRKMRLTYSGIFYNHNTPKYFLKAFNLLRFERPDIAANIELHFVGDINKSNKKLIRKLNLREFVRDHGYIDHKNAISKIKSSDVLWMMLGKWKYSDMILPGKLYEYMGSGKPIIACLPDGTARNAAKEYGASFITEPDDVKQIKDTLIKVYDLYLKNELPKPDEEYIFKFRREYLTDQLTKQFQFLVKTDYR